MKKYFVFILFTIIGFIACNDNSSELLNSDISIRSEYLKVSDFDNYGKLHNELLTQASLEYPNGLNSSDSVKFVNTISDFCKELILTKDLQQRYNFTKEFSVSMSNAFDNTKNQFLVNNPKEFLNSSDFLNRIHKMMELDTISIFYHSILVKIYNDVVLNLNGNLSYKEFQVRINDYINEFNNHQYSLDSSEGMVLAITLSLAKNSIEWWMNSENNRNIIQKRIAPWLAADIIGAVLSGGADLIGQATGGGDINWWEVGAWTVAGAAGMSIGVKLK